MKSITQDLGGMSKEQQKRLVHQIYNLTSGLYQAVNIPAPEVIQQRRGRPTKRGKKRSQGSTRRDTSAFEIVNEELDKKRGRRGARTAQSKALLSPIIKGGSPDREQTTPIEDLAGCSTKPDGPSASISSILPDRLAEPEDEESLPSLDDLPPPEDGHEVAHVKRQESV